MSGLKLWWSGSYSCLIFSARLFEFWKISNYHENGRDDWRFAPLLCWVREITWSIVFFFGIETSRQRAPTWTRGVWRRGLKRRSSNCQAFPSDVRVKTNCCQVFKLNMQSSVLIELIWKTWFSVQLPYSHCILLSLSPHPIHTHYGLVSTKFQNCTYPSKGALESCRSLCCFDWYWGVDWRHAFKEKEGRGREALGYACPNQQSFPQINNQVFILCLWGRVMVGEEARDI